MTGGRDAPRKSGKALGGASPEGRNNNQRTDSVSTPRTESRGPRTTAFLARQLREHVACEHDNTARFDDDGCREQRHRISARRARHLYEMRRWSRKADRYIGEAA